MPTLTLIDGSGFIFRAYHALPPLTTTKGQPTNAVYGFTTMLLKALRERAPTHVALVFDAARTTFRHEIDPGYKASRPEAPDDLRTQFPLVRDVARALRVPVIEEPHVEADDVIGALACRAREQGWDVVVVTGDKDFAQLVDGKVTLYDPMAEASGRGGWTGPADVEKKLGVRPEQVVDYMAILGDKIDDVPGIPGVGEVTAASLVRHFGTIEAMLERPDEIPKAVSRGGEKLKDKIVGAAERIRTNKRLVALRCDLELPFAPDAFGRQPPDDAKVRALFSELEFSRLLKDLPAPPPTPRAEHAEVIRDRPGLDAAVAALRAAGVAGIRPVLAGPSPRTDPLVGVALGGAGRAWYLPLGHRYLGAPPTIAAADAREGLRPLVEADDVVKHAHDLKAAMHAFAGLGLAWRGPGLDTDLASRLLLPTRREHALADVARERIGCELPRDPSGGDAARKSERVPVDGLEVERVGEWAAPCAAVLADLAPALERTLAEEGLEVLHREVERPLVPVIFEMERAGIAVDRGAMEGMSAEFGRAMEALEARIHAAAGHPFNIASTRELAQVLFVELELPVVKRLKTGPSTDVDVLEKLAESHPLPALVLEHRGLAKLKGTYVDALPHLVGTDGRIHTTFHQAGAATGRLSSTDPNLQNIPIRNELSRRIREAFVAPAGRWLVSADYSQIELRILAHYSKDPALLEAFRAREDVHTRTAAETFGVQPSDVTPDMRRVAKVLNFGIAYGLSAFGLSQRLDLPPAEAQAIIDRYFTRYAGVRGYIERAVADARKTGESRTLFGRARAMPEIGSRNPALRNAAERTAINTPIQGTAADVVKIAMIRVHAALAREGLAARLLLQVHDELVLEVPEGELEPVEALVRTEMMGAATLEVPLEVEIGHGRSWAGAH
jgi:DNA polymerase I